MFYCRARSVRIFAPFRESFDPQLTIEETDWPDRGGGGHTLFHFSLNAQQYAIYGLRSDGPGLLCPSRLTRRRRPELSPWRTPRQEINKFSFIYTPFDGWEDTRPHRGGTTRCGLPSTTEPKNQRSAEPLPCCLRTLSALMVDWALYINIVSTWGGTTCANNDDPGRTQGVAYFNGPL